MFFGNDVKLAPIDASSVGNERSRAEARGSQTPTVWAALEEGPSRVRAIAELPPLWLGRSRLVYDVTAFWPSLPTHTPMRYLRLSSEGFARDFSRNPGGANHGGGGFIFVPSPNFATTRATVP